MEQKTILIVDDDSRNIFALSLVLKSRGYPCISASQANEGIAIMKENAAIGIVLLDMMMPGMDGYQALQVVKNDDDIKHIPVIAVTAQAMAGDKEKCLEAGADGYISKPVNVDELSEILQKFLK